MSLRTRLLAAFAYVLVLVIVALEVPLALNLSRRVDAEIRSEAQGQAQLLSASVSGRLDDSEELDELVSDARERLGGRVIVVDSRGRLLADSAGSGLRSASYASRPEIAAALRGEPTQGEHRKLMSSRPAIGSWFQRDDLPRRERLWKRPAKKSDSLLI